MKTRVLWIEDNALSDLQNVLGPIFMDGHYDLVIAEDASEGIRRVMQHEFDAVIVDIRLPPGEDQTWINLYNEAGQRRSTARLGLVLLYSLLCPEDAWVKHHQIPDWIRPYKFAVFTVESWGEVQEHLNKLKVTVYEQKTAQTSTRIILDILNKVIANSNNRR